MDTAELEKPTTPDIPPQLAVARPNPFHMERVPVPWAQGMSCAEILLSIQDDFSAWTSTRITLNGIAVKREYWHRVYPKAGVEVVITCQPRGGDAFRFIAIVGLAIFAPYAGGPLGFAATGANAALSFSTAAAIGTAATFAVGMLAINALLPPSLPQFDNGSTGSQALSVTGARNQLTPFGVKPIVLGTHKFFPYYAAQPVTELQGDDQYVTMLFVLGQHNVQVDNIKIGDTPINQYDEVDYELDTGGSGDTGAITLYNDIVKEEAVNRLLLRQGDDITYGVATTEPDTDYIIYDIAFPQGLLRVERDGDRRKQTVTVVVEISDDGIIWTPLDSHSFTARSSSTIRRGYRHDIGGKQVIIRMYRTTDDKHDEVKFGQTFDDVYFGVLRSFRIGEPVNDPDWAAMAIRIKATDQLNATPDEVNVLASSIIPDWTGSDWVDGVTNNPASIARWVLTGSANPRPLDVTRLDDAAFKEFHIYCASQGFAYNKIIDYNVTVWELLTEVCHAGRARPLVIDGLFTVKIDDTQITAFQSFSPRNSWDFTGMRMFPDMPHALRVRYVDEQRDYENDEQIVYYDGYNKDNATLFESAEFQGVTHWDNIWKHARYTLASMRLQPENFTFTVDFENLAVLPGDRVEYIDDSILVGLGASRVKTISTTEVTLDASLPVEVNPDGFYSFQFRHKDATSEVVPVKTPTPAGYHDTFEFVTPGTYGDLQDLALYGETGSITIPLIVRNIRPGADLSATIECLPYSDALYTADKNTIPPYDPVITEPPGSRFPSIVQVRSDESVMTRDASGSWQVRVLAELGFPQNRGDVDAIIVQVRDWESGVDETVPWVTAQTLPGDSKEFSLFGYTGGDEIQIRARYIFPTGLSSQWAQWVESDGAQYHTVVGKTTPPPEPDILNVTVMSDGTRFYTYTYSDPSIVPPDFFGVRIRYMDTDLMDGTPIDFALVDGESFNLVDPAENFVLVQTNLSPQWEDMQDFRGGRITETGYEANTPGEGEWVFGIKGIDDGGRESVNAFFTDRITLPLPRRGNAVAYRSEWENSWGQDESPGATLTGCTLNDTDGFLYSDTVATTWNNMPTWDTQPNWSSGLVSSVVFTQDPDFWNFGVGAQVTLSWDILYAVDNGTVQVDISLDGGAWVPWVDKNTAHGPADTFAFRMTITTPGVIAAREFTQEGYNSA